MEATGLGSHIQAFETRTPAECSGPPHLLSSVGLAGTGRHGVASSYRRTGPAIYLIMLPTDRSAAFDRVSAVGCGDLSGREGLPAIAAVQSLPAPGASKSHRLPWERRVQRVPPTPFTAPTLTHELLVEADVDHDRDENDQAANGVLKVLRNQHDEIMRLPSPARSSVSITELRIDPFAAVDTSHCRRTASTSSRLRPGLKVFGG